MNTDDTTTGGVHAQVIEEADDFVGGSTCRRSRRQIAATVAAGRISPSEAAELLRQGRVMSPID